tara:strand:+ start:141 stop:626 length:486 start_codon:yes stop_codon:yes gene_type:complete
MNLQNEINIAIKQVKIATESLCRLEEMQAKELAKPKSKRALFIHKNAFCVNGSGGTFTHGFIGMVENDNAFIDQESAQLQAQRNKLVYRMRVAALECPVNWNDKEEKYFLSWACDDKETIIQYAQVVRSSQLPHFACYAKLKNFMNSLSKDQQKLLIYGVE